MANNAQFSTNLGLPNLPSITEADPRLYNEFILIYNALRSLAVQLDRATGLEFRDNISQAQYKVDGAKNTYVVGNSSKLYLLAGEALTFGQMIHIFQDGKVYKARGFTADPLRKCHGYCSSESVAANEVVEVSRTGIITTSGLTVGAEYQLFTNGNISILAGSMSVAGRVWQNIGIAISDTEFLVDPSKDWFEFVDLVGIVIKENERTG